MAQPYDASLKDLIAQYPADWLPLAGVSSSAPIEVIDAEVSTVTAAADKVLRILEVTPWLLHLELQSSPKADLGEGLLWYNVLLRHRHGQRVRTLLVLLRPAADSPRLNGLYQELFPGEPPYLQFHYRLVRVWQQPVETLLAGGLGTLPLAPISAVAKADLPAVVRRIDERLTREATRSQAEVLGAATIILTGLRLPQEDILRLYQGAHFMSILKDSSAYQMFLEEGQALGKTAEARTILLRQGRKRFGPPEEPTVAALEGITDLERLERMSERLLDVAGWQELLATP